MRDDIAEKRNTAILGAVFVGLIVLIEHIRLQSAGLDLSNIECGANTYKFENVGQTLCVDCLKDLDYCSSCGAYGICDECEYGYYLGSYTHQVVAEFPICEPCIPRYDFCLACDADQCLECEDGRSLSD